MKRLLLFSILFALSFGFFAQTWNQEIAPIIYENCIGCHNDEGIAPFSLTSYSSASNYAEEIIDAVNASEMPPWPADPDYRHFKDEKVLSATELELLNAWFEAGTPEGTGNAPALPGINNGPFMTDPDFVWDVDQFQIPSDDNYYRTFVIELNNPETLYMTGAEFIPGNNEAVHHYLLYYDITGNALIADQDEPGPGFISNGASMPVPDATMIEGWAPGDFYNGELPIDVGHEILPDAVLMLEVHYAPGNLNQYDESQVRLKFSDTPDVTRPMWTVPVLHHYPPVLQEGWLIIPANTVSAFHQISEPMAIDYTLLGAFPHMHLLGQTYKVWLVTEGNDSIPIIYIDDWDFHWQYTYVPQQPIMLPEGSRFYSEAFYDNTANNEDNPNDPPQLVLLGEGTQDEMMLVFFSFTYYLPGDENFVLDSTVVSISEPDTQRSMLFYPNPSGNKFYANLDDVESVEIFDLKGAGIPVEVEAILPGTIRLDLSNFETGVYTIVIRRNDQILTQRLVKQ